jgi:CheY-like chemotaxis protein
MEPFFTTKGIGKGTGLGLSMVHGLAQQSGGRFGLKSKPGQGTTAELWLPVAHGEAPAKEKVAVAAPASVQRTLSILVVDDDALVLTNTVAMLEDLGHSVRFADSGKSALQILKDDPSIEFVITDQAMPQMTGLQFADAVAKEWPDLPVLLTTGFAEIEPGVTTTLPRLAKPFTQHEMAEEILRLTPAARIAGRVVPFRRVEVQDK